MRTHSIETQLRKAQQLIGFSWLWQNVWRNRQDRVSTAPPTLDDFLKAPALPYTLTVGKPGKLGSAFPSSVATKLGIRWHLLSCCWYSYVLVLFPEKLDVSGLWSHTSLSCLQWQASQVWCAVPNICIHHQDQDQLMWVVSPMLVANELRTTTLFWSQLYSARVKRGQSQFSKFPADAMAANSLRGGKNVYGPHCLQQLGWKYMNMA